MPETKKDFALAQRPRRRLSAKTRARRIALVLAELYPNARCALNHQGPLQLLLATILAAQCTDKRVNLITPALFARYPDAAGFAHADPHELEGLIQSTNFFRSKAKNLIGCCQAIVAEHGGQVPATMAELVALPGVGRKTANVVLGTAYHQPAVIVDTHVKRLSQRMGLTTHPDPGKIETDLMALLPRKDWTNFSDRMIFHGRQVCQARKPSCGQCKVAHLCLKVGVTPP